MPEAEDREIDLPGYIRIFIRRKRTIFLSLAAFLLLGFLYLLFAKRVYEAASQLLVERSGPKVLSIEEVYSIDSTQKDYYRTQCEIITSRSTLQEVIGKLGLKNLPPFSRARDPVQALRRMISAQPIRDSRLITVSVRGRDPKKITEINHTLVEVFIQRQLEDRLGISENASGWLADQIAPLRIKLEEAEERARRFLAEAGISSIEEARTVVKQKITSVNKSLIEARKERMATEVDYLKLEGYLQSGVDIFALPLTARDELIKELKMEKIKLDKESARLQEIYRPSHPELIRLQETKKFLEDEMNQQVKNIVEITRRDYETEKSQEETLEKLLDDLNDEAARLNELGVTFNILDRDVESSRKLYESVVERLKETDVIEELASAGVRVVDRAEVPLVPIRPRKKMILILSGVFGLLLGLALAVYQDKSDTSFPGEEDAEKYLKLPVLGKIPYLREKSKDVAALDLISHTDPRSLPAESFRHLRTSLESVARERGIKSILITSASPREGKTDVAINLAITLAETGRQVLLLDTDLRRPRIHLTFSLPKAPGFRELLEGESRPAGIVRPTAIPNLSVITSGASHELPSELLESRDLRGALKELKDSFDYLILDSPPVIPVTDALILAQAVDGIVQVVQGNKTGREVARAAKNMLSKGKAPLLGIILAQTHLDFQRGYYNYYS